MLVITVWIHPYRLRQNLESPIKATPLTLRYSSVSQFHWSFLEHLSEQNSWRSVPNGVLWSTKRFALLLDTRRRNEPRKRKLKEKKSKILGWGKKKVECWIFGFLFISNTSSRKRYNAPWAKSHDSQYVHIFYWWNENFMISPTSPWKGFVSFNWKLNL